jgi:hypothetical protein
MRNQSVSQIALQCFLPTAIPNVERLSNARYNEQSPGQVLGSRLRFNALVVGGKQSALKITFAERRPLVLATASAGSLACSVWPVAVCRCVRKLGLLKLARAYDWHADADLNWLGKSCYTIG